MTSCITQFINSRYNSDNLGDYGYTKCTPHANKGRLINFADIFAQLGKGFVSSTAACALMPTRYIVGSIGLFIATPLAAAANGIQYLVQRKHKSASEIFEPTALLFQLSGTNLMTFKTSVFTLAIDAGARVACIGADIAGVAFPQIGQKVRKEVNALADEIDKDLRNKTIIFDSSDSKISKIIFENVWPRADKYSWSIVMEDFN